MLKQLKSKLKEEKKLEKENEIVLKKEPIPVSIQDSHLNLEEHKVKGIDTVYYIRDFINKETEQALLHNITLSPPSDWIDLPHSKRRLQKWGGDVTAKGLDNIEPLPEFYQVLAKALKAKGVMDQEINHVLLNEYQPGIGIMPHTDGPLYFPFVCIFSLASTCAFSFYQDYEEYKGDICLGSLLIEPRSLLIFKGKCYSEYLHCIADTAYDPISVSNSELHENLNSNFLNFPLTSFSKEKDEEIKKEISTEGSYERNLPRNLRYSITLRHVFPAEV